MSITNTNVHGIASIEITPMPELTTGTCYQELKIVMENGSTHTVGLFMELMITAAII